MKALDFRFPMNPWSSEMMMQLRSNRNCKMTYFLNFLFYTLFLHWMLLAFGPHRVQSGS